MSRVLTLDVGNSNIVIGCFNGDTLEFADRIETHKKWSVQSLTRELQSSFVHHIFEGLPLDESEVNDAIDDVEGSIISSVVPDINDLLAAALKRLTGCDPLIMNQSLDTGISTDHYDTTCLGQDRVVDMAAAVETYGCPVIVYDLGTATTLSLVDKDHQFIGGLISPGVQLSLNALAEHTSQLPQLTAEKPTALLGTDTLTCMNGGVVIGTAAMIDGIVDRIQALPGNTNIRLVLTGGLSKLVIPWLKNEAIYDPDLLLRGLFTVYRRNVKPGTEL